jgi:hypothetical protein
MAILNPALGDRPHSQREAHPVVVPVDCGRPGTWPMVVCLACGTLLGVAERDPPAEIVRVWAAHRCPP